MYDIHLHVIFFLLSRTHRRSNLEFFRRGRDDVSQDISCLVSHAELPGSNRLDSYERLVGANLQQVRG